MGSPTPTSSTYQPVLSLYELGNLETEFVEGEAYQSPIYSGKSSGGEITGYETKYNDDKTYYLIDEGVSDLDLFSLSATDQDTPTSSLSFGLVGYTNLAHTSYGYGTDYFDINSSNILSLANPFEYSDQGDSYNRYSVSVFVDDGSYKDFETLNFQVTAAGAADVLQYGDAGNNTFDGFATGYKGIDGGDGVDTVNYDLESENVSFSLSSSSNSTTYGGKSGGSNSSSNSNDDLIITATTATTTYSSKGGTVDNGSSSVDSETLSNIERLYFTDKAYALDLDGNAGIAAKVIIATFGASDISTYMAAVLPAVDAGSTLDGLCDLVVQLELIESLVGSSDMSSFVEYVYGNVVGRELNAFEAAMMENISTGGSTKAELLKLAVQTDDVASQITTNAIDLIGVAGSSDGEKLVISFDV
jgi:hypothetical protein